MGEGSSTSKDDPETQTLNSDSDTLIIQDLLEDMINKVTSIIVDSNGEANNLIVDNIEPVGEGEKETAKKRPEKRVNKAKKRKRLYNLGEEYVSKKGKTTAARSLGTGCDQKSCKRRCHDKIDPQLRLAILKTYWGLGQSRMRWDYIAKTVKVIEPKFRRTGTSRQKETSRVYTFTVNDEEVIVCKKFYLHTLSIAETVVTTALNKKMADGGFVQPDERGAHSNRPQNLGDEKDEIRRHIESFPVVDSHYCRKSTSRQYLSPLLSIEHMHRLYVDKRRKEGAIRPAKLTSYKTVFSNEYNLGFFRPMKDICSTCSSFEKSDDKSDERTLNQEKHREEINDIRKFRDNIKKEIETDKTIAAATFDLEEVLPLPKTNEGDMYYLRQLNNFNLSVYGYHDRTGHNYLWNESTAKRGSNEIASCLIKYLDNLNRKETFKTVTLLSDSCGGQNRNRPFMAMLWWAAQKFDFQEIRHGFFVRGHSENESDSIHARIEAASKHVNVYTTPQWATIIQGAKRNKPYYTVTEMVQEDFLDFKQMSKQIINMNKTTDRETVKFMKIRLYSVRKGDPLVTIHYNLNESAVQMNLFQSGRKSIEMNLQMNPLPAYTEQLKIDVKKYKDLDNLCERGIIPKSYHAFYRGLVSGEATSAGQNSDSEYGDEM